MYLMKILKPLLLTSLLISLPAISQEEDCESTAIQIPAAELLGTMKVISEGLYKDISTLKVNLDGEGKLSVLYEKGVPKLIKLTYTNGDGTSIIQKSFDEIANGVPLVYENKSKPGKAIILEKGSSFKNGNNFSFSLKVRTSLKPEKHTSYPIEFNSDMTSPKLLSNSKSFKSIVLSPGVSLMSWDGTFKKVEFK